MALLTLSLSILSPVMILCVFHGESFKLRLYDFQGIFLLLGVGEMTQLNHETFPQVGSPDAVWFKVSYNVECTPGVILRDVDARTERHVVDYGGYGAVQIAVGIKVPDNVCGSLAHFLRNVAL